MLLVPEQVKGIIEAIRKIEGKKENYKNYLLQRDDVTLFGKGAGDLIVEDNYAIDIMQKNKYEAMLKSGQFLYNRCLDHIDIGTSFKYCFVNEPDVIEEGMLVESLDGISANDGYISVNSPFGKKIYKALEGDIINCEGPSGIEVLRIVEIDKNKDNYINFIRSVPYRNRRGIKSKKANVELRNNPSEYERRLDITSSQEKLLMEELSRIAANINSENKRLVQCRVSLIMSHLKNREIARPWYGDTIGIGTKFSVKLFGRFGEKTKNLEMINLAVSDELDSEYVERISPLGMAVLGLKNGDEFKYFTKRGWVTGYVYDIQNVKANDENLDEKRRYIKK